MIKIILIIIIFLLIYLYYKQRKENEKILNRIDEMINLANNDELMDIKY